MDLKNVLLIQVPFLQKEKVFPLGLAYIASFIRQYGFDVTVLDLQTEHLTNEKLLKRLSKINFDIVGISALVNRFQYVSFLSKELKRIKPVPIVVGNGLGTGAYKIVLENIPEVDICVIGEGEETFLDILKNVNRLEEIPGISYRRNGTVILNPNRIPKVDINAIPWPAYDLIDMDKYIVESSDFLDTGYFTIRGREDVRRKIAYMITARGCPYNCKFCGRIIKQLRLRNIKDIIEEVKFIKNKYDASGISFYDELLVLSKKRVIILAEELKKLDILWSCQGRVNLVDIDLLKKMKECGCVCIGYGIESGSQKILDAMDKKVKVEDIISAMQCANQAGLAVKVQLIFGYPGEDEHTVRETIELFLKLKNPGRRFNIIRPLPGSRLYDELIEAGIIDNELEFIKYLETSLDMNLPIVNLTSFVDDEIKLKACRAESIMLLNYLWYMIRYRLFQLLKDFLKSRGSFKTVMRYLLKLILTMNKSLFNFLLRDRYPKGYKIYSIRKQSL